MEPLKAMRRCPGCNHEVPENASKCNYCGIALDVWQKQSKPALPRESDKPSAGSAAADVPLVMKRVKPGPPEGDPPQPRTKALPAPTIRPGEAFRVGLQLTRRFVQIMKGRASLRSLNHRRNRLFENLGKMACHVQLHHRDLSPIYDKLRAIEQQEAEKRAAIHAIEQEGLSQDPDIRKAEIALRKVKTRKHNRALVALNRSKAPIFRDLGETANGLRLPAEGVDLIYTQIEQLTQEISRTEAEVQGARVAVAAVDKRKKWFVYVIWMYATIIAVLITWAVLVVVVGEG